MEKLARILFIHVFLLISISCLCAEPDHVQPVAKWFKSLRKSMAPKLETIEYYVQHIREGPNQTVWEVATANITATSPTKFGQMILADSKITAKPEFDSLTLGRAQGLGGFSDLTVLGLYMNHNVIFTRGKYNGSTITISGRNQVMDPSSELSVVGGTGYFRLARGIAVSENYNAHGISVLKYTVYVTFY